jgi:septal ring factor EnvC (AmiA/AmiB activator)
MSNLAKVFIVLNFVLSIVFLASAGSLLAKTDEWRKKYEDEVAARSKDVRELNDRLSQLNSQFTATAADRDRLKGDLGEVTTARDKYMNDWKGEQAANAELRKSVEGANQTLRTIEATLSSAQEQIAAMQRAKEEAEAKMREAVDRQRVAESEVTRLTSETEDQSGQIDSLGRQIASLSDDRERLQTLIDMAKEAGFDVTSLMAQPAINGKVVDVDPRAGVVVLSVGAQAEVKKGFRFQVFRGNQYVGEVIVDAVYPDLSAASVVRLVKGMDIRKLDDVATRL